MKIQHSFPIWWGQFFCRLGPGAQRNYCNHFASTLRLSIGQLLRSVWTPSLSCAADCALCTLHIARKHIIDLSVNALTPIQLSSAYLIRATSPSLHHSDWHLPQVCLLEVRGDLQYDSAVRQSCCKEKNKWNCRRKLLFFLLFNLMICNTLNKS